MRKLPDNYNTDAGSYKLVKREGDVAIYKHSDREEYEVFRVRKKKAWSRVIAGRQVQGQATEAVPSPSSWGKDAFTVVSLDRAEELMEKILKKQVETRKREGAAVRQNG